jgi:predicted transcriptional regulator
MKRITVHLSDELHKRLKVHAVLTEDSISRVVAHAVDTLLNGVQNVPTSTDSKNHS